MALECVLTPHSLDEGNKDTQQTTEGEKESDDRNEENPIDLEDGEIIDSGGEDTSFEKQSNAQNKNDVNSHKVSGEEANNNSKKKKKRKKRKGNTINNSEENKIEAKSPKKARYDQDRTKDTSIWFKRSQSPNKWKKQENSRTTPNVSPTQELDGNVSEKSDLEGEQNIFHDIDERRPIKQALKKRSKVNARGRRPAVQRSNLKRKRKPNSVPEPKRSKSSNRQREKRREPMRTKAICKFYLEGKCLKGNDCQYSHDASPLKKKDLCKFFLNGFCAKGETCLFMHGEFPCKFFHTNGKCLFENACRFSHEPLTDEMKRLLDKHLETTSLEEEQIIQENCESPPMLKKPSLLGSPPRHVKEAAEEWQNDLLQRQHLREKRTFSGPNNNNNNNGPSQNSPGRGQFNRPNFYVDTLPRSPVKLLGSLQHGDLPENEWCINGGRGPPQGIILDSFRPPVFYNHGDMTPPIQSNTPVPTDEEDDEGENMMRSHGLRKDEGEHAIIRNHGDDHTRIKNLRNDEDHNRIHSLRNDEEGHMMRIHGLRNDEEGHMMRIHGLRNDEEGHMNRIHGLRNDEEEHMMRNQIPRKGDNHVRSHGFRNDEEGNMMRSHGLRNEGEHMNRGHSLRQDERDYEEDFDEDDIVVAGDTNNDIDERLSEKIRQIKAQTQTTRAMASPKSQQSPALPTSVLQTSEQPNIAEDSESQSTIISQSPTQGGDESNSSDVVPTVVPITIPNHLPRRQRELFLRIQQHQKRAAKRPIAGGAANIENAEGNSDSQGENASALLLEEELQDVKETEVEHAKLEEQEPEEEFEDEFDEENEEEKPKWYSSDEDDDNGDQLTAVLKKLQEKPPPVRSQPTAAPSKQTPPSAPIDIAKMLSSIRQQATQGSGSFSSNNQTDFWQNLLSATIPFKGQPNHPQHPSIRNSHKPIKFPGSPNPRHHRMHPLQAPLLPSPPILHPPPHIPLPIHLQHRGPVPSHSFHRPSPPHNNQQHLTLNDPVGSPNIRDPRYRSVEPKPFEADTSKIVNARDPRLLARDPRMPASVPVVSIITTTKEVHPPTISIPKPLLKSPSPPPRIIPVPTPTPAKVKERRQSSTDKHPEGEKKSLGASATSSYRLHVVTVSPLNYSSYLFATQNDTRLLSDPRLKKLLEDHKTTSILSKPSLPFPPELKEMLKQDSKEIKSKPTSVHRPLSNVAKTLQEIRAATALRKVTTTRLLAAAAAAEGAKEAEKEAAAAKNSSTPPYVRSPEISPSSSPAPTSAKPKPTTIVPTSHIPRSVIDPRLARLHNPIDPRRSMLQTGKTKTSVASKINSALPSIKIEKEPPQIEQIKSPDAVRRSSNDSTDEKIEPINKVTDIIKGGSVNRKSSLDYASPLNSYSEPSESSGYNSYNRKPQPRIAQCPSITENSVQSSISDTTAGLNTVIIPQTEKNNIENSMTDFNENMSEAALNQSLKEVFKTIDPTASPFC